jgi:hypothetical protein
MNEELVMCAQINFENLERAMPNVKNHPFYKIAKGQLDEACGGKAFADILAADMATEIAHKDTKE